MVLMYYISRISLMPSFNWVKCGRISYTNKLKGIVTSCWKWEIVC